MGGRTLDMSGGYGDGYGSGCGSGYGSGCGSGYGSGYGCGDGYGYGSGYGDGYGYGSSDGYGYGCGDGYGSGSGYGYGCGTITLRATSPWQAYHWLKLGPDGSLRLRGGGVVQVGEVVSMDRARLKLCGYGLHASFAAQDAQKWAPAGSVLTKVEVWGRVIVAPDKLVAQHRRITEVVGTVT